MTREVSFQGVTVRLDPDETTTVSGFECAARLDSHSLKPGWPNEWSSAASEASPLQRRVRPLLAYQAIAR